MVAATWTMQPIFSVPFTRTTRCRSMAFSVWATSFARRLLLVIHRTPSTTVALAISTAPPWSLKASCSTWLRSLTHRHWTPLARPSARHFFQARRMSACSTAFSNTCYFPTPFPVSGTARVYSRKWVGNIPRPGMRCLSLAT